MNFPPDTALKNIKSKPIEEMPNILEKKLNLQNNIFDKNIITQLISINYTVFFFRLVNIQFPFMSQVFYDTLQINKKF